MIEVHATITIVATDDAEADAVYAALREAGQDWPNLPVLGITETYRELVR